jgi:hypothetical protein
MRGKKAKEEFIITNKDVLTQTLDEKEFPLFLSYTFKGKPIVGKMQLIEHLTIVAEDNIRHKYLRKEIEELLKNVKLVKLNKKDKTCVWKLVEFVEKEK